MKKIVTLLIIFVIFIAFPQKIKSELIKEWEPVGPYSKNVRGMAFNPLNSQEMYALISESLGYIYKTENSGYTWTLKAQLNSYCYDISVDPQYPNTIFVLGKHSVFKSVDSGATWQEYRIGDSCYGICGQISINPNNSSTLYVSGCHYYSSGRSCMALFSSTDGGENWTKNLLESGSKRGYITCLSIDPIDSNVIYCGGYYYDDALISYYKMYKSSDGGENWSDKTGSIDGYPRSIVIDSTNPSQVYLGTTKGIYRSSNGGSSWQKNNGSAYAYYLCIDPMDSDTFYAGYNNCCYKSEDGGVNWTNYTQANLGSCNKIIASSSPNSLFYVSNTGICRSDDNGLSWDRSDYGLESNPVYSIAIAQSSPNIIYGVVTGKGLYRSCDFGTNWEPVLVDDYWCASLDNVKVNPNNENDILIYPGPAG